MEFRGRCVIKVLLALWSTLVLASCGGGNDEISDQQAIPSDPEYQVLDCDDGQGTVGTDGLDAAGRQAFLCRHNKTRSQVALGQFDALYGKLSVATNMKRLQWDDKLAQVANGWADGCHWGHNPDRKAQYNALSPTDIDGQVLNSTVSVGENIAYKGYSSITEGKMQFALDGYDAWANEGHYYSFGNLGTSDHCEADACGHFTQLIWANTYKVGCAVNYCPEGTLSSVGTTFLVCNYALAGNYGGQQPYLEGSVVEDACSEADEGQSTCGNGLTASESYSSGL